jgi:phage terminase large subunit-like protein
VTQPDLFAESAYKAAIERARVRSAALEGASLAERLARLPKKRRDEIISSIDMSARARLAYEWKFWARPKQRPPNLEPHRVCLWMSGRGFGKSKCGAERIRERVDAGARSLALIGPTTTDIERYMLGVGGDEEGLLHVFPKGQEPRYLGPPKSMVYFHTGAIGYVVTAERPEFRGANLDTAWCDEIMKWKYLSTIWNNLELATRKPASRVALEIIVTTTPRRLRFLKELIADEDVITILGNTHENAGNLDRKFLERMQRKLGGTRLGRQELGGELLDDNPGALFHMDHIETARVNPEAKPKRLRVVVAVDPAIATNPDNDQTGIIVLGIDPDDGHIYVLADLSGKLKPHEWGSRVVDAYDQWGAVAVVGERNRGGDLVEANVRASYERKRGATAAQALDFINVHATKGKDVRAEPVATLCEKAYIHIVGMCPELETEITEWDPSVGGVSPNRLDALVWGVWYLAGLGEEIPTNYLPGFRGVAAVNASIRAGQSVAAPAASRPPSQVRPSPSPQGLGPRRI